MPTLLQISQLGHPILREKAKEVENVKDPAIQALIDDMISTCQDVDGVGIAAPQVYQPLRLFIIASKPSPRYPHAPDMEPTAIINPTIVSASEETEKGWEGCLSIPGIRGQVPRHKSVKVSFTNRNGEQEEKTFDDFVARVFQHEYDHIDGIVFLDRANPKDLITEKEYQRIVRETATKKYPPISARTKVKTTQANIALRKEWTDEAWEKRKWGVQGTVITHHDSHGLCYDVRHEDGTEGCYDPSELEVV